MNDNGGTVKTPLNRDLICATALEAIDEVGLDAVSMRRLARALGVKASSLYYHFGSRDELLAGVVDFLYRTLGPQPDGGEWRDQVRGALVQLSDFMQGHPNATPLLLRNLAHSQVPAARTEALYSLACRSGLDPSVSADLVANLVALLVGHTFLSLWAKDTDGPARVAFPVGLDALIRGFTPMGPSWMPADLDAPRGV